MTLTNINPTNPNTDNVKELPKKVGDVTIDYSRDELLTDLGKRTLRQGYMLTDEQSPQECFARASNAWGSNPSHRQRLYDYASKGYFGFASPVLANAGTKRGLPISCFLNSTEDSILGISDHYRENAMLSTKGGGIGGYWGNVRSSDSKTSAGNQTPGPIPFLHVVDSQMLAFYQGATRRGAYAAYLPISHPDIEEFIQMRDKDGDHNRRNRNLHHGVSIPDDFIVAVRDNLDWPLLDPSSNQEVRSVPARALWDLLMETRIKWGEPYLFFSDSTNKQLPYGIGEMGYTVTHSNLCSEITLRSHPATDTSPARTAVCCLSSINVAKFKEWEPIQEQFIMDLMEMLDNVLQYFIDNAGPGFEYAIRTAAEERSVGLGIMGLHSYLQQLRVPMDSPMAIGISNAIQETIWNNAEVASTILAKQRGVPQLLRDAGIERRFTHKIAIAPTANNADICGQVSPSIEPWASNYFQKDTKAGSFTIKNPELVTVLQEYEQDTPKVWKSILKHKGSVQHLDFLSDSDKWVFKTAFEMDQMMLIELAAQRQKWICQAQSLNLFFPAGADRKLFYKVHMEAWKKGLKSLYYVRSEALKRGEMVGDMAEKVVHQEVTDKYNVTETDECVVCQG